MPAPSQLLLDSWRAVPAFQLGEDRRHEHVELLLPERTSRRPAGAKRMVTGAGEPERTAHERLRVVSLLRRDELEAHFPLLAKKAAAFRRKSRSIVTVFSSRRSRVISARSSLVSGPCGSCFSSISARCTQARTAVSVSSSSRATCPMLLPLVRTSRTTSALYSGVASAAFNPFITRTYDALNRLKTVTDERGPGHTTTYDYDPGCGCSDRVTKVTDPLGHTTETIYDANGRRSSVKDANGHPTSFVYDARGHLTDTHFPDGTSTHEEYDARGRRISMTVGIAMSDPAGKTTFYGYDDQGQLTSVTDPLAHVTSYSYDPDGNLKSVTDANGNKTTYEYDLFKRKIKRTLPLLQVESFVYNSVGNEKSHTDFRGKTTTMNYDHRDRMLTKVPDPSLSEPSHGYTYSGTGMRLTSTDGTGTTIYNYDERDRLRTKATPPGTAGTLTYTYDHAGNVETINSSNANGTSVRYTWDEANQLEHITDYRLGQPGIGVTTTASYTPTRRPATLAQPNGIGLTYSYDALDRVTSMLWRQGTSPAFGSWAYTHNERGQRHELDGRHRPKRRRTAYDDASRLTSETITGDPRGTSFNGALSYVLDGAGNRLSRTSTPGSARRAVVHVQRQRRAQRRTPSTPTATR